VGVRVLLSFVLVFLAVIILIRRETHEVGPSEDNLGLTSHDVSVDTEPSVLFRINDGKFRNKATLLALSISPDESLILSGDMAGQPAIWNRQTGQLLRRLHLHNGWVSAVMFSPDGNKAATGGTDRRVYLSDTHTGTARGCLFLAIVAASSYGTLRTAR
jgi:WD40 repeat protein